MIDFQAIFGLIVLAEVFFIEDNGNGGKSDFFYDDDTVSQTVVKSAWETPKPIR